jgi:hypothetical protein
MGAHAALAGSPLWRAAVKALKWGAVIAALRRLF